MLNVPPAMYNGDDNVDEMKKKKFACHRICVLCSISKTYVWSLDFDKLSSKYNSDSTLLFVRV